MDEYNRLEAAASALAGVGGSSAAAAAPPPLAAVDRDARAARSTAQKRRQPPPKPQPQKPGRPAGRRRAGRRKGSGTRAAEALSFVQGQPGITIPELAAKMGIKQNYLYRVLPGLEQEGKVKKQGRGWHPEG